MITDILQSVFALAQKIYIETKRAEYNHKLSELLQERIKIVINAIHNLGKIDNSEHYRPGLVALESCLKNALKLIGEFSKKKNLFMEMIEARATEEQFNDINEQLQKCLDQLNLGMLAQLIINHQEDKNAHALDRAFMQKQQEEMYRLNVEALRVTQQLQFEQKENHLILLSQLASIKERVVGQQSKKPEIEAHLQVPYSQLQFHKEIGVGSFGKVYAGQWCKQTVAIKSIDGKLSNEEHEQFVREVQIMVRLRSPHIVQLYGACLESERHCLVMEYMEQGSLDRALSNGLLTQQDQRNIAIETAKGLLFLHAREMVHCNLKSNHIFLSKNGAKLSDFGLSKVNYPSIKNATEKNEAIAWQAPECLDLHPKFTPESDIYAYGMVLWEMLTGKKPFVQYKDQAELLKARLSGELETIPSELPSVYKNIIQGCWQKTSDKRPSLQSIINQLESYQPASESKQGKPEEAKQMADNKYYEEGIKLEQNKNYAQAFLAYQKAVAQGHIKAHTNVGFFYLQGLGGATKDAEKAFSCFLKAAEKGHTRAMVNLAALYKYGKGTSLDLEKAKFWYNLASEQGDEKAKTESIKLQSNLQSQVQTKNKEVAQEEKEKYIAPLYKLHQQGQNIQTDVAINQDMAVRKI